MNRHFKEIGIPIHEMKKAVQCLAWHPESTSTDLNLSPFRNYLAVGINSPTINILDVTELLKISEGPGESSDVERVNESEVARFKVVARLTGHTDKIVAMAWNPHLSGYLMSASYDNTVQIWNIETQALAATYVGHKAPVHCCMWSPLNPDYAITGSSDFTVRIWKISEQEIIQPSEKVRPKCGQTKKSKRAKAAAIECPNGIVPEIETAETEIAKPEVANENIETVNIPNGAKPTKERAKKVSYLSSYTKRLLEKSTYVESLRNLVTEVGRSGTDVANRKDEEKGNEKIATIFGTPEDIAMILDEERSSHTSQGHYNTSTEMSVWNCGLRKNLQEAIKEKRLNDFLVSLSVSLSMKTWQETCEAYADQLLFESNPTKAVSYLLCIHKIHRAIEVFIAQKMYKEAYVLARCKVDEKDEILTRILNEWANSAITVGNFEEAAQCHVKLGDFAKAAKLLGRRHELQVLELATELGQLSKESGLSESLAEQAFMECLLLSDCQTARKFVDKFPQINHRRAQIEVFEEMKKIMENVVDPATFSAWIEAGGENNFLEKLRSKCEKYVDQYNILSQATDFPVPENEPMLWIITSHHLALFAIADSSEKQICHLITAIGAVSQYETVYPSKTGNNGEGFLIRLLVNLENKSPENEQSLFAKKDSGVYRSLRAFLCLGVLNWLNFHATADLENLEKVLKLVEKLIEDTFDQRTVKYSTMTNEINKLGALLATALGTMKKKINNSWFTP